METIKRGYEPKDKIEFGPKAAVKLNAAAQELAFLLDRGYDTKSVSTFVGNHHLLHVKAAVVVPVRLAVPRFQRRHRGGPALNFSTIIQQAVMDDGNGVGVELYPPAVRQSSPPPARGRYSPPGRDYRTPNRRRSH